MECCGFLWERMNGRRSTSPDILSKYSSDLSYYTSACKKDKSLKPFDTLLHQRTNKVISSLVAQAKTQPLNVESLMEVNRFLFGLNEDAVRVIIDSREYIQKNKDLKSLVDVYFKSSSKILDFCNTVENCVKKADISQLLIRLALKQFEIESVDTDVEGSQNKKKKYAKTLEEVHKYKAMGNAFDEEFLTQYKPVYEQKVLLMEELSKLKVKLEKKQKNVKIYAKLTNVFFVTAYFTVFVLSVVSAAMIAPPVVSLIAAILIPTENARNWCNKMWKKYEKTVKKQIGLVSSLEIGAEINNKVLNITREEVEDLNKRISLIQHKLELGVEGEEDEEATRQAMQEIKEKVDGFSEKIKQVGENAAKYSRYVALERLLILEDVLEATTESSPS